jgi:hypothetical protein
MAQIAFPRLTSANAHLALCPTQEELKEMTPDELRLRKEAAEINVFGEGFERDSQGKPIERGIGSPGNENHNHRFHLEKEKEEKSTAKAILAAAAKKG